VYASTLILIMIVYNSGFPPLMSEEITSYVSNAYSYIETLGPDDVIVIWSDNPSAWLIGHVPGAAAIFHHAITHGTKVINVAVHQDGPIVFKTVIAPSVADTMEKYGYEYGEDYVNIGFIGGLEAGIAAFYADMHIKGSDVYGTPLDNIPMMKNIKTLADCTVVVPLTGWTHTYHMRQAKLVYDVPVLPVGLEGALASWPIFVEAEQMLTFIHGWTGAAEYERLLQRPGMAMKGLNALSVLYFTMIFWIIIGNISYFGKKLTGGGGK
jgi:hypothetical protein